MQTRTSTTITTPEGTQRQAVQLTRAHRHNDWSALFHVLAEHRLVRVRVFQN